MLLHEKLSKHGKQCRAGGLTAKSVKQDDDQKFAKDLILINEKSNIFKSIEHALYMLYSFRTLLQFKSKNIEANEYLLFSSEKSLQLGFECSVPFYSKFTISGIRMYSAIIGSNKISN